jgi:hypothetical protein
MSNTDLVERLRKRTEIRRQIPTRKSVQEGQPDRISDLLEEAANHITELENHIIELEKQTVIAQHVHLALLDELY